MREKSCRSDVSVRAAMVWRKPMHFRMLPNYELTAARLNHYLEVTLLQGHLSSQTGQSILPVLPCVKHSQLFWVYATDFVPRLLTLSIWPESPATPGFSVFSISRPSSVSCILQAIPVLVDGANVSEMAYWIHYRPFLPENPFLSASLQNNTMKIRMQPTFLTERQTIESGLWPNVLASTSLNIHSSQLTHCSTAITWALDMVQVVLQEAGIW